MPRWTELLLAVSLLVAAGGQEAAAPGKIYVAEGAPRAVLLEAADFFAEPSSDGDIVARLPAGRVLEYAGETGDVFGRTWYTVRDPKRLTRRRDEYLVPFDRRQFRRFGYVGALLADRSPSLGVGILPINADEDEPPPWWQPVSTLELGHDAVFEGVVGISATTPNIDQVRDAIDLLGGREALAVWPADPLPGQLFVPEILPALFQFDGAEWDLVQPVRLLGEALDVLGNGSLRADSTAMPLAGGPTLYCWDLVGPLDPRGTLAGSVQAAPPPVPPAGGVLPPDIGPFDATQAPPTIRRLLPPAPPATRVPQRVDPPERPSGVLLTDDHSHQAVYLQQTLAGPMAQRLGGQAMVLDVFARDNPRGDAATFGVDIEVAVAGGEAERFSTSFTSTAMTRRYELAFEVPAEAESLTVRLLPLDLSLAVEQQGSVVFERVALRRATWNPAPPAATVLLYRISAHTFEGALLHTRARIAVTSRPVEESQRAWARVAVAGWSEQDGSLVLAGELRFGMSPEQVRAAWGAPQEETSNTTEDGVERRWDYPDRYVVFFNDEVALFRPRAERLVTAERLMCPGRAPLPETERQPLPEVERQP